MFWFFWLNELKIGIDIIQSWLLVNISILRTLKKSVGQYYDQ